MNRTAQRSKVARRWYVGSTQLSFILSITHRQSLASPNRRPADACMTLVAFVTVAVFCCLNQPALCVVACRVGADGQVDPSGRRAVPRLALLKA